MKNRYISVLVVLLIVSAVVSAHGILNDYERAVTIIFDIDEPGKGVISVNQRLMNELFERMKANY